VQFLDIVKGAIPRERYQSFDVPLRRKFPLSKPATLRRKSVAHFNRGLPYAEQIKPFNFLQMLTPALLQGDEIRPIAPFEKSDRESRKLPWTDLHSGKWLQIDWNNVGYQDTVSVVRLDDFIEAYAVHPESKAADSSGACSIASTKGLLHRLRLHEGRRTYIGKEVDRLDEADGWSPDAESAASIEPSETGVSSSLDDALARLHDAPRAQAAERLGISVRRWQDILKKRAQPRKALREKIIRLAWNW